MAKQDDTARSELRDLLVMLRDALGQPPLGTLLAALAIRVIRMLSEQDLGKRMAMRDQISAYLAVTPDGQKALYVVILSYDVRTLRSTLPRAGASACSQ